MGRERIAVGASTVIASTLLLLPILLLSIPILILIILLLLVPVTVADTAAVTAAVTASPALLALATPPTSSWRRNRGACLGRKEGDREMEGRAGKKRQKGSR